MNNWGENLEKGAEQPTTIGDNHKFTFVQTLHRGREEYKIKELLQPAVKAQAAVKRAGIIQKINSKRMNEFVRGLRGLDKKVDDAVSNRIAYLKRSKPTLYNRLELLILVKKEDKLSELGKLEQAFIDEMVRDLNEMIVRSADRIRTKEINIDHPDGRDTERMMEKRGQDYLRTLSILKTNAETGLETNHPLVSCYDDLSKFVEKAIIDRKAGLDKKVKEMKADPSSSTDGIRSNIKGLSNKRHRLIEQLNHVDVKRMAKNGNLGELLEKLGNRLGKDQKVTLEDIVAYSKSKQVINDREKLIEAGQLLIDVPLLHKICEIDSQLKENMEALDKNLIELAEAETLVSSREGDHLQVVS